MLDLRETPKGVTFRVRVIPNAARTELAGVQEGVLKIRVAAPPIEGRANDEIVSFLAKIFKVAPRKISVTWGEKARVKTILIAGLGLPEVKDKLSGVHDG